MEFAVLVLARDDETVALLEPVARVCERGCPFAGFVFSPASASTVVARDFVSRGAVRLAVGTNVDDVTLIGRLVFVFGRCD